MNRQSARPPGIIEIINDYASAAVDPAPRDDDWHLEFAQIERHAVSLEWAFPTVASSISSRPQAESRLLRRGLLARLG